MKKLLSVFLIAAAVVFFAAGILSLINTGKDPNWLTTDGVVLGSTVESHFIESTENDNNGNLFYDAWVSYNFILNGQSYTGKCVVGNASRNDPTKTQKYLEFYPEGKIIKIWYNPEDPEKSVIDTHSNNKAYIRLLIGLFFLFLSVLPSLYIEILADNYPSSQPSRQEITTKITDDSYDIQNIYDADENIDLPENIIELAGLWDLDYQIPSLREIISSGQKSRITQSADRNAVMETGFESLSMMITGNVMELNYKDINQQGGCSIISHFNLSGNRLDLVHKNMDFMIADVAGFPPTSYTYIRKGAKLTLLSNEIEGMGKRRITYHFSLSGQK